MTRKRFKKLLMAEGYSRNESEAAARDVNSDGIPYAQAFVYYYIPGDYKRALESVIEQLQGAIEALGKEICSFHEAFDAGIRAFTDAFCHKMQ